MAISYNKLWDLLIDKGMKKTDLAAAEERISKKKAAELFEHGMLDSLEAGTFESLKAIHKYLFEDIYDFAGELRTVNIAKGNFRFVSLMYLEAALANIDKMPQSTFDEIVEKYVEMNIAHPFREGNGRTQRAFLTQLIRNAGYDISFADMDTELLMIATIQSTQGVTDMLKQIFQESIK